MQRLHRYFALTTLTVAAACAASSKDDGFGNQAQNSRTTLADGGSNQVIIVSQNGDASLSNGNNQQQSDIPPDANFVLGADGSVGTCIAARSCDTNCDQLVENGQHEYIEQMPDDGSALPPSNAASLFSGTPSTSGGPCIVEPPDGALFPNNWVRARIRFKPASTSQTIFQIRIHADRQQNDLVVYTSSKTWEIPKDVWQNLAQSTWGEDITVTVSAVGASGGNATSSSVKFQIAPAFANGSMVYWAAVGPNAGQSWLESFGVGDDNATQALTLPDVQWPYARTENGSPQTRGSTLGLPTGSPACIGCHVAAPDRNSVLFVENWPWDAVGAMVDPNDTGKVPTWLTPGGSDALSMPWLGMMSFSTGDWAAGNHVVVASYGLKEQQDAGSQYNPPLWDGSGEGSAPQLAWFDLSTTTPSVFGTGYNPADAGGATVGERQQMLANFGTSWGFIARDGDPNGAACPTWSHDGKTVTYVSTNVAKDGRLAGSASEGKVTGVADLYSVPYNGRAGGTATPIPGAATMEYDEYYPSYSPDDKYIAFNRTPNADGIRYYAANAEINVIKAAGGTPQRLAANDPPSCMGVKSPGVTNSWAKWSPEYPNCGGKTYYWLIFSSTREQIPFIPSGGTMENTSQLYLTALVDDGTGNLTSYPAIFIWNQHTKVAGTSAAIAKYAGEPQSNHTPQWEPINLPTPPPPPPPPPPPR